MHKITYKDWHAIKPKQTNNVASPKKHLSIQILTKSYADQLVFINQENKSDMNTYKIGTSLKYKVNWNST